MRKIIGNTTATPLAMGVMAKKVAESLLYAEELYNFKPYWAYVGTDGVKLDYSLSFTPQIDLKAGETYIFSIVAPNLGDTVKVSSVGDLHYAGDRYTGKVTLTKNLTTLDGVYITFALSSPENDIDVDAAAARIIIEKASPIREKFDDIETQIGDIETALDNIIAIQNNLIGGEG